MQTPALPVNHFLLIGFVHNMAATGVYKSDKVESTHATPCGSCMST